MTTMTILYVKGVSEAQSWVFHHHSLAMNMKAHVTLKRILVHTKDKDPQENVLVVTPGPL